MIIIWSDQAEKSYNRMIDDILERWNPNIAENFENITNNLLDKLKKQRKLCPPSLKVNLRKCVIHKNVSLIYKIHKTNIELIAFIDNRSDNLY
ncbi:MAG: type II toxin-antitoxin system RelE/ParE family toxin [Bacteroidetes bacterium]|nr:MAG: type II toxin-antitoxin system RelE/ParE family toxin [Bacteroidota bacterium]